MVGAVAVALLVLSGSIAKADEAQMIREGLLENCWSESKAGTVDGTFIVTVDYTGMSRNEKAGVMNHVMALINEGRALNDSGLILLGFDYWHPIHDDDSTRYYLVQADFDNPMFHSRQALKEAVARSLVAVSKIKGVRGASCLIRNPYKPSVSGSN